MHVRDLAHLLGDLPEPDGFVEVLAGALALGTQLGGVRGRNEDRCAVVLAADAQERLLATVICDGIGGLPHGDRAASIAVASFAKHLLHPLPVGSKPATLEARAINAVLAANAAVFAELGGGSGCTLSTVVATGGGECVIGHVGDSAIFSVTEDRVTRLTRRHTLQGELQRIGQKLGHPGESTRGGDELLEYVGMSEPPEVDSRTIPLTQRCRLVIMSDGAIGAPIVLDPLLAHAPTCRDVVRRTLALSKWTGGHDNASVIAVDLPAAVDRCPVSLAPLLQTPSLRLPIRPSVADPLASDRVQESDPGDHADHRRTKQRRPGPKRERKDAAEPHDKRDTPELEIQFIDQPAPEGHE